MISGLFHMLLSQLMLGILIIMISILGTSTMEEERNKNTPFECGFDPKDTARMPFSLRFFLLAVVFLIFDIEVTLLLPIVLCVKYNMMSSMLGGMIFLIILLAGLAHEWNEGSLSWVK